MVCLIKKTYFLFDDTMPLEVFSTRITPEPSSDNYLNIVSYGKEVKRCRLVSRKAQIASEYLFILGIVLVVVLFVVGKYAYSRASGESRIITAQRTVDILSQTADDVYKLGQGNQKCAKVEIPKGVVGSSIAYGDFLLRLESGGQQITVKKYAIAGGITAQDIISPPVGRRYLNSGLDEYHAKNERWTKN